MKKRMPEEDRQHRAEAVSGLLAMTLTGVASPLDLFDGVREPTETAVVQVVEDVENRFFEIDVDGEYAGILVYEVAGKRRILTHTFIKEGFRGRGLVTQLLTTALSNLAEGGHTITSYCPIVNEFLLKNPQLNSVLDSEHPGTAARVRSFDSPGTTC